MTSLENAHVLVTGGAGFVGGALVEALCERGVEVTVFDHFQRHDRADVPEAATVVEGDVRREADLAPALDGVDVVCHQASASKSASARHPRRSHGLTTDASLLLLDLARERDVRVVLASSSAVYGEPAYVPVDEAHPLSPDSTYGVDKACVDRYARLYHERYGLETVVLRYFNVYGPERGYGEDGSVVGVFLERALADEDLTVEGDGAQTRDFVHVSDAVRANLLAATTDHVGEAFNVGTGVETSVADLADLVRDRSGTDGEVVHTETEERDVSRSVADLSRARDRLGYDPQVALDERLETFLDGR